MLTESKKNFIDELEKLRKQLKQEQLLKAQAVNKLAEIMNRKDNTTKGKSKVSSADLRRKEKECRKLQQELTQVCDNELEIEVGIYYNVFNKISAKYTFYFTTVIFFNSCINVLYSIQLKNTLVCACTTNHSLLPNPQKLINWQ